MESPQPNRHGFGAHHSWTTCRNLHTDLYPRENRTLVAGITFFGLFPIATNFPEYRLLASLIKWLFWNIPTHGNETSADCSEMCAEESLAEWLIVLLKAEGQRHRATVPPRRSAEPEFAEPFSNGPAVADGNTLNPPTANAQPAAVDYGSYDCSHDDKSGNLILNAFGVRFISSIGHKQHFNLGYEKIEKLEKVTLYKSHYASSSNADSSQVIRIVSKGLSQS